MRHQFIAPLIAPVLLGCAVSATAAPLIDIYAGGYTNRMDISGQIKGAGTTADFESDLGFDEARQTVFYIGMETDIPFVPNVRVQHSRMEQNANGRLSRKLVYDGVTFNATTPVESKYDIQMTDATLYFTPIDLGIKVDVGLTARHLKAEFAIDGAGKKANKSTSVTFPMVYAAVSGQIPTTGFYLKAQANAIGYDDNELYNAHAGVGWRSDYLFGIEAGVSAQRLKVDQDDFKADFKAAGPYVALSLSF